MKRLSFLLVLAAFSLGSTAFGGDLFPFVLSFDAPDNITNIANRLDAPAGKHGFVRVDNGQFVTDAGRIKFWGTNTCFGANFLSHEASDRMADRMARFGINCVRLHHMDMRDIWGTGRIASQMTLDPGQLDKLDYFIAALKKRGIYVNMNLHVSRSLDERDGFPPNVNRPSHDKGIDNYYRPLIDANKKYAFDLLTHVNPYTGTAYKDEPAVAMIEINNENSIICTWGAWGDLHQIQDPFLADLRNLWNDWLLAKYADDASLQKAWNCRALPLGNEMLQNGDFPGGIGAGWNWETNANTDAPVAKDGGALRLDVRKKGDIAWHPQLIGSGLAVAKDQVYTLEVKAKANRNTTLNVGVRMNHEPWEGLGFDSQLRLTRDWQTFSFTVMPTASDANARVAIGNFNEGIVYDIASVSLKPGGTVGLDASQTLAAATIPVVWKSEAGQYPKEMTDDFCDFLLHVEAKYWDEMYRYLKDEIKVRQPVSGTQLEYGSTHAQAAMDYCDIHAYWNHPVFPGRAWDMNNWYLHNRALVNALDREILPQLATKRVAGKPFTVSEYNHPYPNQYAAEGFPLLAAFGAFQDWDGIFPFAYSHSNNPEPQMATSFFDTSGNTVQMAHMIACQTLFNADIDVDTVIAPLTAEKEREIFLRERGPYGFGFRGLGLDPRLALTRRVAIDVSGAVTEMPQLRAIPGDQRKYSRDLAIHGNIQYNMETQGRGFTSICFYNGASLFTGFVEEGKEYSWANMTLKFGKTNLDWATVSLTTIEKDKRFLLVATGEMRNTDMQLESLGDDRVTVGNRWGKAPVLCEGIPATILLKGAPPNIEIRYWPLDESGNRREEHKAVTIGGDTAIVLKPEYKTIWYEIEIQ